MARDPVRRYTTADALAQDLQAFLDGQPITAREPSLAYLARMAYLRHRALCVTVLCAVFTLAAVSATFILDGST